MANEWSGDELAACADAYLDMAKKSALKQKFVKKAVYEDLASQTGRSVKSIELRMQNISAVVRGLDKQWLSGLTPAVNVGANVELKLASVLQAHPNFEFLLPLDEALPYELKLPAMREWLIRVAQAQGAVTYGDVMEAFEIGRFNLRRSMDHLGYEAKGKGEPILTALIVSKATGHCNEGIEKEFGVHNDELERQRLYEYWSNRSVSAAVPAPLPTSSIKERAARFASVEVRPDQAAFRRRVYEHCGGRCAISGCSVDRALDAAHRKGRSWRKGHNKGSDGVLLRKDLHALYDNDLLSISDDGVVRLSQAAVGDYSELDGRPVNGW